MLLGAGGGRAAHAWDEARGGWSECVGVRLPRRTLLLAERVAESDGRSFRDAVVRLRSL